MSLLDGLSRERWEAIDSLVSEALELDPGEREAFLTHRCGEDEELRRAVETVIAASERVEAERGGEPVGLVLDPAFLREVVGEMEGEPLGPGARIGAYRIERVVGRGGSGTVFLAHRADGEYKQQVALKVIRRGLDTDDLLARFRVERQILATLSHPNIARLLDGGATPDGRPFLVLEFVEGESITRHCDRLRLSVADRLRLFLVVAEAVQHAHRRLVVHRDLKPSNILVASDGAVKVVDFGIAKLLDPGSMPGESPATRVGIRLLTPGYASPEQIQGGPVSTTTDIYQLGILLHELLTGRHPHPLDGEGERDVERVVCEVVPPAPSAVVLRGEETEAVRVADLRRTAPRRLATMLKGDLDTLILKALEKEPDRRYPSVEQMADDVGRHLSGLPIRARPTRLPYRMGKFVRRHPVGSAAALLVGLLLVGYGVTVSVYADRLEEERDRARLEAANAAQVTAFLTDVFQAAEPGAERGDTLSARTLLDRGVERLSASTATDPAIRASMLAVIGRAYLQLGVLDQAEGVLDESLSLREALYGPDHPEVAATLRQLALVHRLGGEYDQALAPARRAREIKLRELGPRDRATGMASNTLALVMHNLGELEEAETYYREALDILRGQPELDERELTASLNNLGAILRDRGDHVGALPLLEEAVRVREEALGPEHLSTGVSLSNLGQTLQSLGRFAEAEEALRRSLEIRRKQLHEDHPAIAVGMNNLAILLQNMGRYGEAEALHRDAISIRVRALGPRHPAVATSTYNLAQTLRRGGRAAEAEEFYRSALEIWRSALGDRHGNVASALSGLAETLRALGRLDEAVPLAEEALEIRRDRFGDGHPSVASLLMIVALLHRDRGSLAEALDAAREAVEIRGGWLGEAHPDYGNALHTLGAILAAAGRPDEAEPVLHQSLSILEDSGFDPRMIADVKVSLAQVMLATGRSTEALLQAHDALTLVEEALGPEHPGARPALESLVAAHEAREAREQAEVFRRRLAALP
jgi:eukaryotic-like serine/threonine-protein kinase